MKKGCLTAFFIGFALLGWAQASKTIGLVLSGGGAKGLAHVGVLKVLEENNIRPDYIVGTSMGGIVGGMYAAGYSAAEIEEIVLDPEFQEWATGQVSNQRKFLFFPEEGQSPVMVNFSMSLDSAYSVYIQPSLVTDAPLNFALARFFRKAQGFCQGDFDKLAIPFRCVGAEIFTQREIIFKDGSLADAVRATMAVPVVFRPVKIKGEYLFDGGVFNNFPVDVMRQEFDPDLIIGVDVGTQVYEKYPTEKADELVQNPLKFLFMVPKESAKLEEKDVFLPLPVDEISPADFELVKELVEIGYSEAQKKLPELLEKTNPASQKKKEIPAELRPVSDSVSEIVSVKVTGENLNRGQQRMVQRLLWPGKFPVSVEKLEQRYYMLTSQSFFEDSYPHFLPDSAGQYTFELSVNPNKKVEVGLGGNLSSRNVSRVYLEGEYTFFNSWLYQLRANVFAGVNYTSGRLQFRTMLPKSSLLYFESSITYNRQDYSVLRELFWDDDVRNFLIRTDRYADMTMGWSLPNRKTVTLSARYFLENDTFWDSSFRDAEEEQLWQLQGALGQFEFLQNSLDYQQFPTQGSLMQLRARYVLATERSKLPVESVKTDRAWAELKARYRHYFGSRVRFGYDFQGAWTSLPAFENSFFNLLYQPEYTPNTDSRTFFNPAFRANSWVAAAGSIIFPLDRSLYLHLNHHAMMPVQQNQSGYPAKERLAPLEKLNHVSGGSITYQSPFGPMGFSANYYHDSPFQWSLMFNIGFIMRNPGGI